MLHTYARPEDFPYIGDRWPLLGITDRQKPFVRYRKVFYHVERERAVFSPVQTPQSTLLVGYVGVLLEGLRHEGERRSIFEIPHQEADGRWKPLDVRYVAIWPLAGRQPNPNLHGEFVCRRQRSALLGSVVGLSAARDAEDVLATFRAVNLFWDKMTGRPQGSGVYQSKNEFLKALVDAVDGLRRDDRAQTAGQLARCMGIGESTLKGYCQTHNVDWQAVVQERGGALRRRRRG